MLGSSRKVERFFVNRLLSWGAENLREFPWRSTQSPLEILIAEVVLQRTPAPRVAKRYEDLVDMFGPSFDTENEEEIIERFKDLGLMQRMRRLVRAREMIDDRFGGVVPSRLGQLLELPGVGIYTANAVLCFAFGQVVPIIDVNVTRVLSRFFAVEDSSHISHRKEVEQIASSLVPKQSARLYNFSLLDFGAMICRKRPRCKLCPIQSVCAAPPP